MRLNTLIQIHAARTGLAASLLASLPINANADVITDWNIKAGEIIVESKMGTPPAIRVMAVVQTAAYEAVNAITKRYPSTRVQPEPASGIASGAVVDAAVAAAHCATLAKLIPSQQASIDTAYQTALAKVAVGPAKAAGIAVGEKAAAQAVVDHERGSVPSWSAACADE